MCILLVVDLAFTALPFSSVASPGCSPSLLGTELTILRGRGAAYSKEVLAIWTRANGIGSIGSNLRSGNVPGHARIVSESIGSSHARPNQSYDDSGRLTLNSNLDHSDPRFTISIPRNSAEVGSRKF